MSGEYSTQRTTHGTNSSSSDTFQLAHVGRHFDTERASTGSHHHYNPAGPQQHTTSYAADTAHHPYNTAVGAQDYASYHASTAAHHPYTNTAAAAQHHNTHHASTTVHNVATHPAPCPYHNPILQLQPASHTTYASTKSQNPLDRFLAEGSGEQSALYNRSDNGQTSLARGCTCGHTLEAYGYQMEFFDEVDGMGERQA